MEEAFGLDILYRVALLQDAIQAAAEPNQVKVCVQKITIEPIKNKAIFLVQTLQLLILHRTFS
jgi:hypothetical protein